MSRRDLPVSQQSIQAGHAAIEHAYLYGRPPDKHPSYIHLTLSDKESLEKYISHLNRYGIQTAQFHEPYKNWGLTAFACLLPESKRELLKHLPLWNAKINLKENENANI